MFRALLLAFLLPVAVVPVPNVSGTNVSGTNVSAANGSAFVNPVSRSTADTFADPTVIRGQDGFWYAYATSDPLRSGEATAHRIPISRSSDLVHWAYVGDALTGPAAPYVAPGASYWAPDVRYLDGRYVMYYAVTDTTVSPDGSDFAIGVAVAPTPTGPWTQQTAPVVAPRPGAGGGYLNTIDPAELTAADGTRYLYLGSYYGGISVVRLSVDGLSAVGEPTMVALDNKYEGAYVVRHDSFYYLFASSANCCAGPATGYSVSVGRSSSPLGPFYDAHGVSLTASRAGGTPVVTQNGNRWIGAGHNGVVTDLQGQDYLVYHAIDRDLPYLDQPYGINRRPMLLDRLDWIDGWPLVRAGAGPSDTPQPAPAGTGAATFAEPVRWLPPGWRVTPDGYATGSGTVLRPAPAGDVRVEADLRVPAGGSAGLVTGSARVMLDRTTGRLTATAGAAAAAAPLPAGVDFGAWHNLAVSVRGRHLVAELTEARQSGPIVSVSLTVPPGLPLAGFTGRGDVDNFSAQRLYRPVTHPAPAPATGHVVWSDEFNDGALGAGWSWVRRDDAVTVGGGKLNWPVEAGDLTGSSNTASVLLRDAPTGNWTAETRLTLDLGTGDVRNYQQAGLIAYAGDDNFARLDVVSIWNTRQIEFGRELPYAGALAYGGITVGTPATTTWLRLVHRVGPGGEHLFREESSTDGRTWTLGGVWTFPAGAQPKIGLDAHGGATPAVTAHFDYVRISRP
ncbi:family 43 glycosylhydrolase [Actinoplanes sp. NPDC026619]|uniref:family 43 glycosylhydrolase n=1 Tax=Actinoplanes sp. NPDC026619 TaxID=3155798 RepID=UPI0033D688A3